jgi:hypothetical protein
LKFDSAIQQIFEVKILSHCRWPEVLSDDADFLASAYEIPPAAMAELSENLRP